MVENDRRGVQRLRLAKPILALMNGQSSLILDIGVNGAYIEHYGEAKPGTQFQFIFRWQGNDVEFTAEVSRSTIVRAPGGDGKSVVSHTGIHFINSVGESDSLLHEMMATFVGRVLAAQKANASGEVKGLDGDATLEKLGEARRLRTRGFISYLYRNDVWSRVATNIATQPNDGFTVAAYEDEEELETLCRAYEVADEEARNLIRLVAELSVLSARR